MNAIPPKNPLQDANIVHPDGSIASAASDHGDRLRALGTLSAGLAHEMNNLLTPMLGYAGLALQRPDDAELSHKALVRTQDAAQRAVGVCAAVMSLARGPQPADAPHVVRVAEAIDQAVAVMEWGGGASDTVVEVSVEPADLSAALAPAALEQVLVNLLQNARRAMGPGGAVVVTARGDRTRAGLELTVQDTGPGVPDERAAHVFEPFVTHPVGDEALPGGSADSAGTGLGLWISRALLEAAGGSIQLAPTSPKRPGACFRLNLPTPSPAGVSERRAA